jgi:hypothetical protein
LLWGAIMRNSIVALVVLVGLTAPATATPPLSPEQYANVERGYAIASGLSIGLGNGAGLVTLIGGSAELRAGRTRHPWATANIALGLINVSLATAWTLYGASTFQIAEPGVIGAVAAHAGVGITDLVVGGIGVSRAREARLEVAPLVFRDARLGQVGGASVSFAF